MWKSYELFCDIEFLGRLFWPRWDWKPSLETGMTQRKKFENLNGWFLSLRTEMTHVNKFRDQDDIGEQVRRPKWSIYEFKDRNDTTIQV